MIRTLGKIVYKECDRRRGSHCKFWLSDLYASRGLGDPTILRCPGCAEEDEFAVDHFHGRHMYCTNCRIYFTTYGNSVYTWREESDPRTVKRSLKNRIKNLLGI